MQNRIKELFADLFPIPRSLTGAGNRETLERLSAVVTYEELEIPSGTRIYDWVVPREWSVKEAYIVTPDGQRICDFSINNLHLVGYSCKFVGRVRLEELRSHIHTIPSQPEVIPYRTSYYREGWGFCMAHAQLEGLEDGVYSVVVDTEHFDGALTLGEHVIRGTSEKEFVFSSYICHPSMAINELSGPICLSLLASYIRERIGKPKYTYRFLLGPETLGTLCHINRLKQHWDNYLIGGLILSCLGYKKDFYLKLPKRSENIRYLVERAAKSSKAHVDIHPWFVGGSEERQYNTLGLEYPVGLITACSEFTAESNSVS